MLPFASAAQLISRMNIIWPTPKLVLYYCCTHLLPVVCGFIDQRGSPICKICSSLTTLAFLCETSFKEWLYFIFSLNITWLLTIRHAEQHLLEMKRKKDDDDDGRDTSTLLLMVIKIDDLMRLHGGDLMKPELVRRFIACPIRWMDGNWSIDFLYSIRITRSIISIIIALAN